MISIKSYLPVFSGFYNTFFEYMNEEMDIEDYNEENKTDFEYDDFEWDYADYHRRRSKECVYEIEKELKEFDIKIKFEDVVSPRYYNYSNDSINVEYTLTKNSFDKFIEYIKNDLEEFEEYLKERYTSYDGFASFYNTDVNTWFNEYLKDEKKLEHCFGAILEFYLTNEGYTEIDLIENTHEENYINFEVKQTV
jgi:hypothetical protein